MPAFPKRFNSRLSKPRFLGSTNLKLVAAFVLSLSFVVAQDSDPTSVMGPSVARVGDRLACRCGGCRNTVGNCPMIRCHSADPMRHRIHDMQAAGNTDDQIIQTIVQEEGIVALASPPTTGWGLFTWVMPGIALMLGFWVYSSWVRRNAKPVAAHAQVSNAVLDRFRDQIDRELDDSDQGVPSQKPTQK